MGNPEWEVENDGGCEGCGRIDPCGYHYEDCTLLEPGDILVERETEREVGTYTGPDMTDPSSCKCHNGHKQNDTVCRWCWARGRRRWDDPEVQG